MKDHNFQKNFFSYNLAPPLGDSRKTAKYLPPVAANDPRSRFSVHCYYFYMRARGPGGEVALNGTMGLIAVDRG